MNWKSVSLIAALIAPVLAGAAFAGAMVTVNQQNLAFEKSELTVSVGDMISFTNNDKTAHNILVNGEGIALNSGLQQPGQTFSAPFMKAGIYQVSCAIHPKMKMTVTVK